jgi:hypothetical protein
MEILLILLHIPCLFLNRCKGTKNIIDKQIILSILASAISIIKEANTSKAATSKDTKKTN